MVCQINGSNVIQHLFLKPNIVSWSSKNLWNCCQAVRNVIDCNVVDFSITHFLERK